MHKLKITIEIWQKGNRYLASAPELDFISQGETFEEAKKNLLEVIKIQFQEMKGMGTLGDYLKEYGFESYENAIVSRKEMVGFEKSIEIIKNNMRTVNMSREKYFELLKES